MVVMLWKFSLGNPAILNIYDGEGPMRPVTALRREMDSLWATEGPWTSRLLIIVNSASGSIEEGFSICEATRDLPHRIKTHIEFAANGGSIIAMRAPLVDRSISEGGVFYAPSPRITRVEPMAKVNERFADQFHRLQMVFSAMMGGDTVHWREKMEGNTYWDAALAVQERVVGEITTVTDLKKPWAPARQER